MTTVVDLRWETGDHCIFGGDDENRIRLLGCSNLDRYSPSISFFHHRCSPESEESCSEISEMEAQFFRFLKIVGVGFKARAESEGRLLFLKLGYSHEVELTVPPAVRVFCFKPNIVCCTGIDKQRVHQFAAAVRSCKPPEVYKGKGIMYVDEVIKKKQGKKSK
ncbi:unnamed protein product [Lactuca saligna]|uniref:Large ribosomal subunit protein uL6 alpha-beta domain-containing protein n=3 Tax=Cichorieae TaxID=219121 RepID=A0AA35YR74_LACSI|nr:unnamed protein product [Lactuca saligna]